MSTRTAYSVAESRQFAAKHSLLRLAHFPIGTLAIFGLAAGWPSGHVGWWALWTVIAAFVYFCWTSCFHELAHQTLTGRPSLDIALGKGLGTLMFVPYNTYRECHIRHHAYLNRPDDFELWPYADPKASRPFRIAFAWFDLLLGVAGAPVVYGRIYWHKDSPLRADVRREVRNEYVAAAAFWSAVIAAVAWFGVWEPFLKAWVIPYYIAGVLQTGRKFTEHLGMSSYDPMLGTRTVMGRGPITRLATFFNFDIFVHGPHHRHPRVPHDKLKRQMSDYLDRNPQTDFPVYRSYFAATREMLPTLLTNPGCGMNAGAAPPGREKLRPVDFVSDVAAEVLADADRKVPALEPAS